MLAPAATRAAGPRPIASIEQAEPEASERNMSTGVAGRWVLIGQEAKMKKLPPDVSDRADAVDPELRRRIE